MHKKSSAFKYQTENGKKQYHIPDAVCREMLKREDVAIKYTYPEPRKGFAVTLLTEKGNFYDDASL